MLTKKIEYGYIILKRLSKNNDKILLTGKEILIDSKVPYNMGLGILTQLVKNGLIESIKGKNGGFYLKENTKITMLDLFLALEKEELKSSLNEEYKDQSYKEITLRIGNILLRELKKIEIIPLSEWHFLKKLIP